MNRRAAVASAILLLASVAFAGFWWVAWRALGDLPARETLAEPGQTASAPGPRPVAGGEDPLQAEPERRVRYVEEEGVVSMRPDGPLLRAPSPEPPAPDAPAPPEPELYNLVIIESAALIDARTRRFRLAHVEAPAADERCTGSGGRTWPCGRRARTALRRLVQRRAIACDPLTDEGTPAPNEPPPDGEPVVAQCSVGGTDLSRWLVENGWAEPTADAPEEWAALHAAARAEGRGLFADDPM